MAAVQQTIDQVKTLDVDQYKYGFETDIESVLAPKGLNEDIVRFISEKKGEPKWMLDWRLEAYRRWLTMTEPTWAKVRIRRLIFRICITTRRPKARKVRSRSTTSIRSCLRPTPNSAFRSKSRRLLAGVRQPGRKEHDLMK